MAVARIRDASLFYEDTGGTAPAVVFSHGLLMDHEVFAPQVAQLSQRFRCVAWDQRGHGRTAANGTLTYWDSAVDLVGLLDHLRIERAALVGVDQGGYISLRVALLAPDRVTALACIGTQAGIEDPRRRARYEDLFDRWAAGADRRLAATLASAVFGPRVDPEPWIRKWLERDPGWVRDVYAGLAERDDITDRLSDVVAPAIVLHGEEDARSSIAKAVRMGERLANCEGFVRIGGAGHAPNLSHPREVNAALQDFFNRHLPGTA